MNKSICQYLYYSHTVLAEHTALIDPLSAGTELDVIIWRLLTSESDV